MKPAKNIVNFSIENIKAADSKNKDFDFFSFEYFARDIEHLKQSHRHEFYALILITGGRGYHKIDFEDYELLPDRIFYKLWAGSQLEKIECGKRLRGIIY